MISEETFIGGWEMLCERFGHDLEESIPEAQRLHDYLNQMGVEDEGFLLAVRRIWATARFFPRPADFLQDECAAAWDAVEEWAWSLRPNEPSPTPVPSPAVLRALNTVGGIDAVKDTRGPHRNTLRKAFFEAYEAELTRGPWRQLGEGSPRPRLETGEDDAQG